MKIFDKKRFLPLGLAGLMLLLSAPLSAQNSGSDETVVVSGYVADAALGIPMAGVKVQAYNNALHSAMTKEDGSFSIKIPSYVGSLTFSLEGCNTVVCALKGRTEGINVVMFSDAFSEIYSPKTVAVSSHEAGISTFSTDLEVDGQIQQSLQGSVLSTMRSGQPGVGATMLIDGINSLNINTQPLIVLDGVILDMGYDLQTLHDGYYNNLLSNINIDDIESVTVLRNGYGIYGSKGANGVILINSRRNKSMATKIDVNISGGYLTMPKLPQMMSANEYRVYASELLGTTGTKKTNFKFLKTNPGQGNELYYNSYNNETDWGKVAYRNSFVQSYGVNVQGGDDIANYNLSVGYAMGDGTLKESDYSRFNLRLNSDIILADKLNLRFDASYSDVIRDMRDDGAIDNIDGNMISAPGFLALVKAPFLSPYAYDNFGNVSKFVANEDEYLEIEDVKALGPEATLSNPLSILVNGDGLNKNYFANRLITLSVTPKWSFNRYLSLNEHFSYILTNADENYYIPLDGTPDFEVEGVGLVQNRVAAMNAKQDDFMSNTYLSYIRRFGAHDINAQAGFRYINDQFTNASMVGYNSGNDKTPNITSSLKYKSTGGQVSQDISLTWWAQGNYSYSEKYYLSASLGITSSSRFGGKVSNGVTMFKVPWGIFPSVSGAWVVSNEPWFKVGPIDYLKLSAGFDLTGNDGFDDSAAKTYFQSVKVLGIGAIAVANIGNNSLQWETTKKITAGLDMNLLNNRLSLSANLFHSNTDNLLSTSSLSYLTGIPSTWSNGGSLRNDGYDIAFTAKLLNSKLFKWEAGASIGHYTNEVTKLPGKDYDQTLYGATIRTAVGNPVAVFYGYKTEGVFSTSQEAQESGLHYKSITGQSIPFVAGDVKFYDRNKDLLIDENDMVQIGDPNPDFYGRIFTRFAVKNLSLSATMTYSLGGDVYNYQRMLLESGSRFMNQTKAMLNHWTAEGQVTDMPRIEYGDSHNNARFSDRWVEDGSYLRLKNVTVSYKIPIASTYLQGITIWGAANNLFTITNYLGSDPEFATGNDVFTRGIDRGLVPQSANFSLGLKINL